MRVEEGCLLNPVQWMMAIHACSHRVGHRSEKKRLTGLFSTGIWGKSVNRFLISLASANSKKEWGTGQKKNA